MYKGCWVGSGRVGSLAGDSSAAASRRRRRLFCFFDVAPEVFDTTEIHQFTF